MSTKQKKKGSKEKPVKNVARPKRSSKNAASFDEDDDDAMFEQQLQQTIALSEKNSSKRQRKAKTNAKHNRDAEEDEKDPDSSEEEEDMEVDDESTCEKCGKHGTLLVCDNCGQGYHLSCLDPPLTVVPKGEWFCPLCTDSPQASNNNTDIQVDKILTKRPKDNNNNAFEYLIKPKDKSYLNCIWISEDVLRKVALQKHRNFEKQYDPDEFPTEASQVIKREWCTPERILSTRSNKEGSQYFIKWKDLHYDNCTWESADIVDNHPTLLDKYHTFNDYERAQSFQDKVHKNFQKFTQQPEYLVGGTLHDYQLEGVNWLRFSFSEGRDVILADEMGLGKTVQTVSYLTSLYQDNNIRGPFLVVVPLSTLRHWHREFITWAPQMNTVVYAGNQTARQTIQQYEFKFEQDKSKNKKTALPKFNVLITSYEMIIQDNAALKPFEWEVVVVDEAHRLKNNNSKLFQVLSTYKTTHRLLLTGTPLQNNLSELFYLLHFLSPTQFNNLENFQSEFSNLTKEDQIAKLHKLLSNHLLRRVKHDVMQKLLPPKTELIVPVELTDLQKQYYKAILTRNYQVLNRGQKGTVSLLNVMIELKKCANHPYLFPGAEPPTTDPNEALAFLIQASGKMMLIDKMLPKLKRDGHRVLIFSQMTRMLDILEDYFHDKGYEYVRIDGSITGELRQQRIDSFNEPNSKYFVFILSTRAGGLGINLHTADTVIIYDSDWNPHNDIQALSRAHRLGQHNKVMIYRLVTRNTIEERIIQMAKSKMMLDHLVVAKMSQLSHTQAQLIDGSEDGQTVNQGASLWKAGELDGILRFGAQELFSEDNNSANNTQYYDDEVIDKLLDRNQAETVEENQNDNEYLAAFKVANFKSTNAPSEGNQDSTEDGSAEGPENDNADTGEDYWEKLLKSRWEQYMQETSAQNDTMYGKGKRGRKKLRTEDTSAFYDSSDSERDSSSDDNSENSMDSDVAYSDSDGESHKPMEVDEEVEPGASSESQTLKKRKKREAGGEADTLLEGEGKHLRVLGFGCNQRLSFLKMLMFHGVGDGSWNHVMDKLPSILRAKKQENIVTYGDLLLKHLLEPGETELFADGVPREALTSSTMKEIIARIAKMHLIRMKYEAIRDADSFDIDDKGITTLHHLWKTATHWKKQHDKQLIIGVLKHGYGKWTSIAQDPEMHLMDAIVEELKNQHSASTKTEDMETDAKTKQFSDFVINRYVKKRMSLLEQAMNIEYHFKMNPAQPEPTEQPEAPKKQSDDETDHAIPPALDSKYEFILKFRGMQQWVLSQLESNPQM